jgi:hypothetical protein
MVKLLVIGPSSKIDPCPAATRSFGAFLPVDDLAVPLGPALSERPAAVPPQQACWYYSGKHRHHGLNHQGLIDDTGTLIWISDGLPGSVHDLTAARTHQVLSTCQKAGVTLLADKGYHGPNCGAITPYKGSDLSDSYRDANRSHAQVRGQGERGFAVLKNWHILDKFRCCPLRAVHYPKAILTLELQS